MSPPQYDWRDLVNTSADHEARANQHRPTDREILLREVLRLRAQGLRIRDVAEALGLNPSAVESLIDGPEAGV
jgi:hypothetical protein